MVTYTLDAWRIDNATNMTGGGADVAGKTLSVQSATINDNGDGLIYDNTTTHWETLSGGSFMGTSNMVIDGVTYDLTGNVSYGTLTFANGASLSNVYFVELTTRADPNVQTMMAFQTSSTVITGDIYSSGISTYSIISQNMPYSSLVTVTPPPPICFTTGTLIATPNGEIAIENLKVGDSILNAAGDVVEIRWIGMRHVDGSTLTQFPKLRPVRITKDALGQGVPRQDLLVSRQHRLLVSSAIAQRLFNGDVLVAAIHLTELPGIFVDESVETVTYVHLLCDEHEIITAHGARAESLHLGDQALRSLSQDALEEIQLLFPEQLDHHGQKKLLDMIPEGRAQKRLIQEHVAASMPMVS